MKKIKQLWVLLLTVLLTMTLLPTFPGLNNKAYADETVVTVGTSGAAYTTIASAVAAKANGATFTIRLLTDITEKVKFDRSQIITLDLNGKVLKVEAETVKPVIINNAGGTLIIKDSSTENNVHYFKVSDVKNNLTVWNLQTSTPGSGTINYTFDSKNGLRKYGETSSCTDIPTSGDVIEVKGGCITGGGGLIGSGTSSTYRFGFGVYNNGTLTLESGNIVGNNPDRRIVDNTYGGGVMNENKFTMKGGAIIGNAAYYGGGVQNHKTFEMKGGYIAYNNSTSAGGVSNEHVHTTGREADNENNLKEFTMSGGFIVGNIAEDAYAGGVLVKDYSYFTMTNGTIAYNICKGTWVTKSGGGGGIGIFEVGKASNGDPLRNRVTISGGIISHNQARFGGGIKHGDVNGIGSELILSGNVSITENTDIAGNPNNICLYSDNENKSNNQTITIGNGGFSGSAGVSSTAYSWFYSVNVTNKSNADYHSNFFSDNPKYAIKNDGTGTNQIVMLVVHNHSWRFALSKTTSDNDTMTATCGGDGSCSLKDTTLTIQAPDSPVYDGTAKPANFGTATGFIGGALPTIYYQKKNGDIYGKETTDVPIDAGTYKAYFKEAQGYQTIKAYVEYTIAKAEVTLSDISATAISYGQQLSDSTLSGTAKYGSTDVTGTWAFKNPSTKPAVSDSQTTEYDVTFTPAATETDFRPTDGKVKLTVNKAKVTVPTAKTNLTYNKTEQTGIELPKDAVYTLSGNKGTNAKADYSATATLTDKNNYEWNLTNPTSDDQSIAWAIAKKSVNVAADNQSSIIGIKLKDLTYTNDTLCTGDAFTGGLTTAADKDTIGTSDILQGDLSISDGNSGNNYTINYTKGSYSVTDKLTQAINFTGVTGGAVTKTFGDAAFKETVTGAETTVTYSSSDEKVATVDATTGEVTILKAGTTTIKAEAASSAEYVSADAKYTLTVNKKKITVTAEDKTMVEGEKLPELTAEVKGLLGDDTVSYKFTKIESPAAGIYCIHPYGAAEQGNYEVAYKDAVLTVSASKKSEVAADSETQKEIYKKYASDSKYADKQLDLLLVTGDEISKADEKLILKEAGTKKSKMMDVALYLIISEEGKETQTKDIGDENDTILRFTYKFDFKNKADIQVLRVHNEKVDELTTTKNKDGEYIEVNKEAGTINVYAKKYSTYAVTYNEVVAPGTGDFGNWTFRICFIIGALSLALLGGAAAMLMEKRIKR